ncbi:Tripartite-type tricarboxylate transporter, receptor component TctC [Thermanaeromonas toyohensis ToBE]|uniref:Tripartite-type tricarboxylate transporter, receptor component TctC n=1 Tax=Thermanaeromonas toyohensis ToBE TaxID=698762 RepID=A0A1W1VV79_9FIRM|nr:tripartite tricarboxylate transporter substrate binding protein [Thermanaeromonas toyohensis]SMB97236.1 Tripartite-type tricarboxylate transporter, receptor component TctC [Thermanaeromonas toyohensis ToBE]
MKRLNKVALVFLSLFVILGLLITACGSKQQSGGQTASTSKYPEKEITLICPWPPGGSSDIISRAIAQVASKYLNKPMVVVNREGANGMIATTELAKTNPDGYTIALGASGLFVTQPFVQKNLGYKQDDFEFLIGLTNEPILLTINAGSPYNTLEDLIKDAKEKNKVIRYSNSGMGGIPQLCLDYLFQLAGVKSQPVPFKGGAPALTAILGGHVDAAASHPGEAIPHIKAGKLRPLAISSTQRFPALPDVPTMKEKGFDIDMGVKKFVFAPKGLPEEARKVLIDVLQKVASDPEFKKTMEDNNLMLEVMSGKEVVEYFNKQAPIMKKLIESMPQIEAK